MNEAVQSNSNDSECVTGDIIIHYESGSDTRIAGVKEVHLKQGFFGTVFGVAERPNRHNRTWVGDIPSGYTIADYVVVGDGLKKQSEISKTEDLPSKE